MERPPVSIIIPAWNAWHATKACLESLRPTLGVRDEVIVVNNGSEDETARELTKYSWVKVITNEENLGFAKGNNVGAVAATNEILVFLNNDTMTPSRWLDELINPFSSESVGATGPVSNYVSGPQFVPNVPYEQTRSIADFKKFARDWQTEHVGETEEVERLVGFCVAIRRSTFNEIGGWDERYGLGGFEDDDLSKALIERGLKLLICKGSFVHHTGHVTFADNSVDIKTVQIDNAGKFNAKHAGKAFVSACLIMRDEEKYINACLTSLRKFADEIVIYDTGSTDNSVELARLAGATVIEGYWDDDFSRARNAAAEKCNGEWILHLDLDEILNVEDKKKAMAYLRDPQTPGALLIPIMNHGDAVTGGRIGHQAVRLFRREGHEWTGKLHEQIKLRGSDKQLVAASFPYLMIDHYGYTAESLNERNKIERNIRLAEADVVSDEGDIAFKRMNLARSYAMGGRMEDALEELRRAEEVGKETGTHDSVLRAIYRSAADYSLGVGRPNDAIEWADKFEALSERKNMAKYLRGQAYLNLGNSERALAEFEGLDEVIDDEGITYSEEDVQARRGLAYAAAQNWDAARAELESAAKNGTATAIWFPLVQATSEAGGDLRKIAELLPTGATLNNALCQLFLADPAVADQVIEAYIEAHPENVSVLAFAIRLAPQLDVERCLVWSDRVRQIGLEEHCPLIARAKLESAPVKQRILAAAVAVACFVDERGNEQITQLAPRVPESDFVNMIVQLNELAPATLKDFIIGAASSPKRSVAIARVLNELGAAEEALVVAEHGLTQPGADIALNDDSREWIERLRVQVGS